MRINQNIAALNTYRQLTINVASGSKSLEKLSSGFRINRAGDDAAGLAISEKMRSQVRGLNQASRNAQDGISLIQTAEGALNEVHSILQRMRELAVQAANDTNTSSDRAEIQKEINQLTSEINRIANTTEFNTKKVLDGGAAERIATPGTGSAAAVLAGAKDLSFGGSGTAPVLTVSDVTDILDQDLTSVTSFKLNGQDIALTKVKELDGSGTAFTVDELVNAFKQDIDAVFDGTAHDGLTFTVAKTDDDKGFTITSSATGPSAKLQIEANADTALLKLTADATSNVDISGTDGSSEAKAAVVTGNDISAILSTDINVASITLNGQAVALTNVAGLDGSGTAVTLDELVTALQDDIDAVFNGTANDGVQFTVGKNADDNGLTISTVATGSSATVEITANADSFTLGLTTDAATNVSATGEDATGGGTDFSTISDPLKLNGQDVTLTNVKALGSSGDMDKLVEALQKDIDAVYDGTANGGLKFTVAKSDDGNKLTITSSATGAASSVSIQANAASSLLGLTEDASKANSAQGTGGAAADGGAFTTDAVVTNGTTDETVEYALDISTHENATNAISLIDAAISKVSGERSKMGAYQNRLEHTINNLGTSAENLTAAESRIRDVDMAKEMMEFTKNNILQQAAQAMLAQANQQPQGVLQLLR